MAGGELSELMMEEIKWEEIVSEFKKYESSTEPELETEPEPEIKDDTKLKVEVKIKCVKTEDDMNKCEKCGSCEVITDDENRVCKSCGVVLGAVMETGAEWRYYGSGDTRRGDDPTRCGMAESDLLPNISNSLVIEGRGSTKFSRLHSWNSIPHREKSLMDVFNIMKEAVYNEKLPAVVLDKAQIMYKMINDSSSRRGDIRISLMAACVYFACLDRKIAKSHKQIASAFGISTKKMTIGCNKCKEILFSKEPAYINDLREESISDIIKRICKQMSLDHEIEKESLQVYTNANKIGLLLNTTPQCSAVSIIYFVCQKHKIKRTKKTIAEIVDVSQVSVGKINKTFKKYETFLFS